MTKRNITAPVTLAGLLCLTAGIAIAQPAPPTGGAGGPPTRPGMRGEGRPGMPGGPMGGHPGMMGPGMPGMGGMQMQDATYLGIEVSPIDPAMKAQLKLAKTDSGLLINFVADNSPAKAAGLQQYDVLAKLDDQFLFNPPQLQSLVRIHKAGDEVKLTYIREGQTQTATAKLETKQQMVQPMFGHPGMPMGGMSPEMMEQIHRQAQASADMARSPEFQQRMRQAMENSLAANRTITYDTDDMSLTVRPENGKPTLIAKDKSGKELFNGPIETPQQRDAIPAEVRKGLDKVAVNYLVTSLTRPGWPMGFGGGGFGGGPARGMGGPGNPGGPGPDHRPDGEQ